MLIFQGVESWNPHLATPSSSLLHSHTRVATWKGAAKSRIFGWKKVAYGNHQPSHSDRRSKGPFKLPVSVEPAILPYPPFCRTSFSSSLAFSIAIPSPAKVNLGLNWWFWPNQMSYLHIETQSLHGNSDHHALTASLVRSAPVKHWDGDFLLMLLQRKHQEHTKTHGCKYNPFTIITAPNFSVSTSSRDAELRGSSSFNRAASPCHCNCPQRPPPHPGRKYQLYRYTPMEDLQVDMIYVCFFPLEEESFQHVYRVFLSSSILQSP